MSTNQKSAALIAALLLAGLVSMVSSLVFGGGAEPSIYSDPGDSVRWGTPLAKLVMNFSMAFTAGSLVFAAFAGNTHEQKQLRNFAFISSSAWAVSAIVYFVLTYVSAAGVALSFTSEFSSGLWFFATEIELGTLLAWNLAGAVLVSFLTLAFSSRTWLAITAAISLAALYPLAESGHASSDVGHALAVNSMLMHLVGISVWVGGLAALYLVRNQQREVELTKRFSTLALISFLLVSVSGVTAGYIRLYSPQDLFSNYGLLLLAKATLLVVLGFFGAAHRTFLIRKLEQGKGKLFARLVLAELAVMGTAIGLGTALARTAPPISQAEFIEPTAAQILTGDPLPREFTLDAWFTYWEIDVLWLSIALFASYLYLYGVWVLKKRGDKWPVARSISWLLGMATLIYVTNGAPNVYQDYLFSTHMVAHMILSMAIPVMLVPGAPVTLLSRAVAPRKDGSWGLREWVLWAVHTPYAAVISHPIFAGVNFALSLVLFYYTPLFRFSIEQHLGHQWMIVHFLITGYLFVQALIGVDPQPHKPSYPLKLMLLIGTMAFHAFFGLSLMSDKSLLLADWFGSMGRTWGESPLADQAIGGAFAWGVGEIPTIIITIIVAIQWSRSDDKERKRLDRASDRSGNQDINDYNEMLKKLNETKERR
ncbi:MAG: hypothetical protein RIS51_48 [Actinomycetota bacterium]